jgi:hypothetical protein
VLGVVERKTVPGKLPCGVFFRSFVTTTKKTKDKKTKSNLLGLLWRRHTFALERHRVVAYSHTMRRKRVRGKKSRLGKRRKRRHGRTHTCARVPKLPSWIGAESKRRNRAKTMMWLRRALYARWFGEPSKDMLRMYAWDKIGSISASPQSAVGSVCKNMIWWWPHNIANSECII